MASLQDRVRVFRKVSFSLSPFGAKRPGKLLQDQRGAQSPEQVDPREHLHPDQP